MPEDVRVVFDGTHARRWCVSAHNFTAFPVPCPPTPHPPAFARVTLVMTPLAVVRKRYGDDDTTNRWVWQSCRDWQSCRQEAAVHVNKIECAHAGRVRLCEVPAAVRPGVVGSCSSRATHTHTLDTHTHPGAHTHCWPALPCSVGRTAAVPSFATAVPRCSSRTWGAWCVRLTAAASHLGQQSPALAGSVDRSCRCPFLMRLPPPPSSSPPHLCVPPPPPTRAGPRGERSTPRCSAQAARAGLRCTSRWCSPSATPRPRPRTRAPTRRPLLALSARSSKPPSDFFKATSFSV